MKKNKSNIKIVFLSLTTIAFLVASGVLVLNGKQKKDALIRENIRLQEEKERESQKFKDMLAEELRISHENMEKNRNYVVNSAVEVGGKTLLYVSEPTPTQIPENTKYINYDSEEFIGAEDGVIHKKDNKVKVDFETENEMIAFYSNVFQLDDQKVANKIYELIELNEDAWKEENILNGKQYSSKEQAIAKTIADISNYPNKYDLTDINVKEYKLSNYKPEELIYKFSVVQGVNQNIALAIAYGESGTKLDSYNFKHNHNVGGLHKRKNDPHPTTSSGYIIFKNEAEGLYRYIEILYNNFSVRENSGIEKINAMSYTYCEDPKYWRVLIGGIYYNLENKGYGYYYNKFNYSRDLVYPTKEDKVYEK